MNAMSFLTSDSTESLDAALAKVQGKIRAASKDAVNPHFKTRYADLTAIWDACRGPLAEHGVSVTQWPVHADDGRLHLVTRVAHGGEWMMAQSSVPVAKQDPQGYGSALTYAKRYALASALGVVADDDDDGQAATSAPRQQEPRSSTPPQLAEPSNVEPATQGQDKLIRQLLLSHVFTEDERNPILARLNDKSLSKLKAIDAIDWIQTQLKERKAAEKVEQETFV
jgi:hypothetical protein